MSALFQTLAADPPWPFEDNLPGGARGARKHYKLLALETIRSFKLPALDVNARLFLWRVGAMQQEALDVMKAWGFALKAEMIWVKTTRLNSQRLHMGMGRQVRYAHEVCLIGVRGRPPTLSRSVRSVFFAPVGRHSAKPDKFYKRVESLSPGPYAELFARERRPGWSCFGDELPPEVDDVEAE